MEFILLVAAIAAGMLCGFVLIIFVGYLLIRFWIKRAFKDFADAAEGMTKGVMPFMQPLRIKLIRVEMPAAWQDMAAVKRVANSLKGAGFLNAGVFCMDEVPDIQLQGLAHAEKSVFAVVYEHPDKGVWFDLVSRFEDGSSFSASTAQATGLDRPPQSVIERFPADADPVEVFQKLLEKRPAKTLLPATAENFQSAFERDYADEMDWRFERGGFTEDEIRKNLALTDSEPSEDQVKQVHAMQQAQVNGWLQTKLAESYRAQANIPEAKWRKLEERVFFVHDRLNSDEVHSLVGNCLDWEDVGEAEKLSEEARKSMSNESARIAFAKMIQSLPAKYAPKKIGHIAQPVTADVYMSAKIEYYDDE